VFLPFRLFKSPALVFFVTVPQITQHLYAKAETWSNSLTDEQWLARVDELAIEQRFVFLELLSFARDGVAHDQAIGLLSFLSLLQHLAKQVSQTCAKPIEEAEFSTGMKRAYQFFHATSSEDEAHEARLHRIWFDSVKTSGEPFLWAGCWLLVKQTNILASSLAEGMVVTLFALVDCYSRRFSKVSEL
jgi:hypothetical protein